MAMKQTQTKLFDFADVGLDFSAVSKFLFQDRFKRILANGYNIQNVLSVSVVGNQVTFEYGVSHGYVADRVLKLGAGPLTQINGGEFVIDSVTVTTVTLTIDEVPLSIAGGFTTHIASLGFQIVYEQANIVVFKFKHVDESDRFLRLCFPTVASSVAAINVCVGRTFDSMTGFINDDLAFSGTKAINELAVNANSVAWVLNNSTTANYNSYTYSQGYSQSGRANVVGSPYHLFILTSSGLSGRGRISGLFPAEFVDITSAKLAIKTTLIAATSAAVDTLNQSNIFCGNVSLTFDDSRNASYIFKTSPGIASFYSDDIEPFQVTSAYIGELFERSTGQYLGYPVGGVYLVRNGTTSAFAFSGDLSPVYETDFNQTNMVLIHSMTYASTSASLSLSNHAFLAFPIEELKID